MNKDSVVIYGGSGFLGSYVADELSEAGYQVRVFDLAPSRYIKRGQEMIVGDLLDFDAVKKAAKGCKYVYNFAGLADIGEARDKPLDTAKVNVVGNMHVLEAAREAKSERFIFASTVYVFSESGSFYRVSKQACEKFIEAYQERYGLDYTILRYGSLYGRRAAGWNGIHNLLKQALEKKELTYEGSDQAIREYIHVKDAARLSVQILAKEYANRHIIITGREALAVKSLLQMIAEMVPGEVKIRFKAPGPDADAHYVMSPYSFNPKLGNKLVANEHIDIGQGLLDCLAEIHEQNHKGQHVEGDLLVGEKKQV